MSNYSDYVSTGGGAGGEISVSDITTDAAYYPMFTSTISGTMSAAGVSSNKLSYNPYTGNFISVGFVTSSDERLKTNIQPIYGALDMLNNLEGCSFDWISTGKKSYGFIAQEVEITMPELVVTDKHGMKAVNYIATIGILVEAIKELRERLEILEDK